MLNYRKMAPKISPLAILLVAAALVCMAWQVDGHDIQNIRRSQDDENVSVGSRSSGDASAALSTRSSSMPVFSAGTTVNVGCASAVEGQSVNVGCEGSDTISQVSFSAFGIVTGNCPDLVVDATCSAEAFAAYANT